MTDLTDMQKRRLAAAMEEAVSKRRTLYLARITGAPEGKLAVFREEVEETDARFETLLNARGLCLGDLVSIGGAEAVITAIHPDGLEIEAGLPGFGSVVLKPEQLLLADRRNDQQRRKIRR